jgi:HPt (histidine-containing phosphotransfer) domain-containing protein
LASFFVPIISVILHILKRFKKELPMAETRFTNLDYLREITGGEPEVMQEFIEMFFDQLIEFRNGMNSYLAEKKWKELGELAHKAKSSVMTFGLNDLGHQLKELQMKTQKLEDIESYPAYVEEFMTVIAQAESELKEELDK